MAGDPEFPKILAKSDGLFANSVSITASAFSSNTPLIIVQTKNDDATADPEPEELPEATVVSTHFLTIFRTVVGLTLLFFAVDCLFSFFGQDPMTSQQQRIADAADALWKCGAGAIFGLLGGKQIS